MIAKYFKLQTQTLLGVSGTSSPDIRRPINVREAAFTKSIAYKLSRDFSFSSFPGA